MRLVLRENHDLEIPRVHDVRKREVDESVGAAERNGGLCAIECERHEALAFTAGENNCEDLRCDHASILMHS